MLYITIMFCVALAMFFLSADLSWSNVLAAQRNDLVFEGRLKEYGAYKQRKESHTNLLIAFVVSVGLISASFFAIGRFTTKHPDIIADAKEVIIDWVLPPIDTPTQQVEEKKKTDTCNNTTSDATTPETVPQKGLSTPEVTPEATGSGEPIKGGGSPNGEEPEGLETPKEQVKSPAPAASAKIETFAEFMPEFPGGEKKLYQFLASEVSIPERVRAQGISAKVYASFVVTENGDIADVKIIRGSVESKELDQEVINALKAMPRWKPGRSGERNVPVRLTIPFSFEIR